MSRLLKPGKRGRAVPFIVPDEDGKFEVTDEALALLRGIDVPVAPVAVAGRYRTGKSFLLNCLVQDPAGFEVGPTVEACTHGIWLWSEPCVVETSVGRTAVLFLDTEGLGANTSDVQHDARVFALATLLCSVLVYNSVGTIDEEAISQLSFVAQLSRHIEAKGGGGGGGGAGARALEEGDEEGERDSDEEDLPVTRGGGATGAGDGRPPPPSSFLPPPSASHGRDAFFPTFLWVVRDFALDLMDPEDGSVMTPREYLESCLAVQPGYASDVQGRNRVRRALTSFFKRRDCATLVRPAEEEEELARLDKAPWKSLRPEFRRGMEALRSRVMQDLATPKLAEGTPVTGRVLAGLATAFVDAINAGGVPSIAGAWEASTKAECGEALSAGRTALSSGLSSDAHTGLLPLDEVDLRRIFDGIAGRALQAYDARAVGPSAQALRGELEARANEAWQRLQADNTAASEQFCARLAGRLWSEHVESTVDARGDPASFDVDAVSQGLASCKGEYLRSARGPAVHKALALSVLDGVPSLVRSVVGVKGAQAAQQRAALQAQMAELREGAETAVARAAVYEKQCGDLRKEKTSGAVERARAEAEAKSTKAECTRLVAHIADLTEEKEAVEGRLAVERREHATARVQLRAVAAGAPLPPPDVVVAQGGSKADGAPSSATAARASGSADGSHHRASPSGLPELRLDPNLDRKFKLTMMPAGGEHIAAPGHGVADARGKPRRGRLDEISTVDFPTPPPGGCGPGCTVQ